MGRVVSVERPDFSSEGDGSDVRSPDELLRLWKGGS